MSGRYASRSAWTSSRPRPFAQVSDSLADCTHKIERGTDPLTLGLTPQSPTIRIWNNGTMTNLDGVLRVIADSLEKAPSPGLRFAKSDLSPEGRGAEEPVQTGKLT